MSTDTETTVLERTKFKIPSMWTVVLHNDDFTPMDFVTTILTEIFNLDQAAAEAVMLDVHNNGRAPVGRFTKEIAETKALQVCGIAEKCEHPLLATAEEA